MGKATKTPGNHPSGTAPAANGVARERGPAGTFLPGAPRDVTLEGVTLEGIYAELQTAYRSPVASHEPVSLTRWRRLFTKSPAEFLRILRAEEDHWRASKEAAVRHQAEFETLRTRVVELEAESATLQSRVAELESLVPPDEEDEYAHPAMERLEELERRLIQEAIET